MAEYLIQEGTLTAIAEAIREKTGITDPINPKNMAEYIRGIAAAGTEDSGDSTAAS